MDNKGLMQIGQVASYLEVSIMTLRRWDASGKLRARRSPAGHRYYNFEDIERFSKDYFDIARLWSSSPTAPEISSEIYCDTQDRFRARLDRMAALINRESQMSDAAALVTAVAGEIGNNSFDHNIGNWPDVPGVLFVYDTNKRLIVLADRGVGIRATLSRVRPEIKDDLEAMSIAMNEQVSGRAPEQRGNGLKFVKDVAIKNKIGVRLQSGTAVVTITKDDSELKIDLADRNIRGVLAKIEY